MDKLDKNKIDELLPRYCEGQVTEEERLLVETWMNESEENRRVVKQIHSLYLATDTIHVMKKVDTEKALSRVKGRITGRKKTMWWEWAQRAAAVLFIPLLVVQLVHYWGGDEQELAQMLEVKTNPGMTTSLTLSDGTVVFLNSESRLTYPSHFNGDTRNVTLQGEAYFEVTRNEEIPFKVHTEELDVKVLGTKFNFRNYKDDLEAKVCLLEGKVALNTRQKETILHPDQQALLDKKTGKLFVSGTKAAYSAEWTNDRLYFDEVLLSDIIKELERSYDVKITVADDTLNTIRFYGNFRKREQSIQEIMNVLSSTDKMTYTMNGKNIVITLPE